MPGDLQMFRLRTNVGGSQRLRLGRKFTSVLLPFIRGKSLSRTVDLSL